LASQCERLAPIAPALVTLLKHDHDDGSEAQRSLASQGETQMGGGGGSTGALTTGVVGAWHRKSAAIPGGCHLEPVQNAPPDLSISTIAPRVSFVRHGSGRQVGLGRSEWVAGVDDKGA
jgi:hypothetical protein